jgi:hypothetical protein
MPICQHPVATECQYHAETDTHRHAYIPKSPGDGSCGAGASAPDGCDLALEACPLECCAAVGGAQFVALWIGALYFGSRPVRSQSGGLVGRFFGRLPVSRWPLPPWRAPFYR